MHTVHCKNVWVISTCYCLPELLTSIDIATQLNHKQTFDSWQTFLQCTYRIGVSCMTNSPSHCSFPRSSSFYRIRLYQAEEVSVLEILVCQLIKRLQNTSLLVLRNPFEAPALALAVLAGCPDQYRLAGTGRGVLFTLCPLSLRNGSRPRFRLPRALSWMFGSVGRAVRESRFCRPQRKGYRGLDAESATNCLICLLSQVQI